MAEMCTVSDDNSRRTLVSQAQLLHTGSLFLNGTAAVWNGRGQDVNDERRRSCIGEDDIDEERADNCSHHRSDSPRVQVADNGNRIVLSTTDANDRGNHVSRSTSRPAYNRTVVAADEPAQHTNDDTVTANILPSVDDGKVVDVGKIPPSVHCASYRAACDDLHSDDVTRARYPDAVDVVDSSLGSSRHR